MMADGIRIFYMDLNVSNQFLDLNFWTSMPIFSQLDLNAHFQSIGPIIGPHCPYSVNLKSSSMSCHLTSQLLEEMYIM